VNDLLNRLGKSEIAAEIAAAEISKTQLYIRHYYGTSGKKSDDRVGHSIIEYE